MLTRVILRPVHIKVLLNAISVIRRIVHHEIEPGAVAGISSAVARNGVAILKKGVAFNEWIPAIMPCIHTVTETIPPVVMDKIARDADVSWNSSWISRGVIDPGIRKESGDRNGRHWPVRKVVMIYDRGERLGGLYPLAISIRIQVTRRPTQAQPCDTNVIAEDNHH